MSDSFLELRMRKSYPGFSLDVDASFSKGVTAIFGPSGSGKTTILNCIAGLNTPDEGEIRLSDRVLYSSALGISLRPEKRRVGTYFRRVSFSPTTASGTTSSSASS